MAIHTKSKVVSIDFELEDQERISAFVKDNRSGIKVVPGIFACGNAVVASALKVSKDIKAHSRRTIGIDMESFGVMYASKTTTKPAIPAYVVKGISDKADTEKDDRHQELAANNSAKVAYELIKYLYATRKTS